MERGVGGREKIELASTVLETHDPRELAEFYERLLGWERVAFEPDWVKLLPRGAENGGLSFQLDAGYVPPVWPRREGEQQMQVHLDFRVPDLDVAVAHAEASGARLAQEQPQEDVRVLFDPHGHVFCLFLPGA